MIARCTDPKSTRYRFYGAKGVQIYERWLKFENFLADMGERPEGHTISRIDHDEDYCPENCEWALEYTHSRRK